MTSKEFKEIVKKTMNVVSELEGNATVILWASKKYIDVSVNVYTEVSPDDDEGLFLGQCNFDSFLHDDYNKKLVEFEKFFNRVKELNK